MNKFNKYFKSVVNESYVTSKKDVLRERKTDALINAMLSNIKKTVKLIAKNSLEFHGGNIKDALQDAAEIVGEYLHNIDLID